MSEKMSKTETQWMLVWSLGIAMLSCLPFLLAWMVAPEGTQYTGLLVNPLDGLSYYAKMQQGVRGDWLFHLPFTPEDHSGAYIITLYLGLGQVAGRLGLPIPLVYHAARLAASLFFLLVAYRFITRFVRHVLARRAAFLFLSFASGLGWLLAPLGRITADLWVAEGFTFLGMLANVHFPLATGLMLLLFLTVLDLSGRPLRVTRLLGACGLGLSLAVVQPLAVPIVLAVLAVYLVLVMLRDRLLPWLEMLVAGAAVLGAAPVMLYDLHVSRSNPALAAWTEQNLTPSLPPWDYALGYGLLLLLAVGGLVVAIRRGKRSDWFLVTWTVSAAALLYVPFALQRRFIAGLQVPLALLAALALKDLIWPRLGIHRRGSAANLILGATALTTVFVPVMAVLGVASGPSLLVMTADEAAGTAWLREHTAWTDTVLAPTETGTLIPAFAGNRVVYGHPFETIEAEVKKEEVARFYASSTTAAERRALLERYGVRYVWANPSADDFDPAESGLQPVWKGTEVVLYQVNGIP